MDPTKNSLFQRILTGVFHFILWISYLVIRIWFRKSSEQAKNLQDPRHLIPPPSEPIPSMPLAQALNPKTPESKLLFFAKSENKFVRRAIVRNPSLPLHVLKQMAQEDPDETVRVEAMRSLEQRRGFDSKGYEVSAI